jgi:acyl-CoA reductase-like NAD-dependent aldehyde dehydrogenase
MFAQLTDTVKSFLSTGTFNHYIAGKWKPTDSAKQIDVFNPSDGSRLCSIANGTGTDVDAAVKAAADASAKWGATPVVERAAMLHRFAELLDKHAGDLALLESLDVGKAVIAARGFDVPFGIDAIRYFADLSTRIPYDLPLAIKGIEARTHRAPLGACGFIFPWNFPFTLLMWGIAPALAAGNTVVVKPSEVTPLSTLYVAHLLQQTGILPAGVFNVVLGDGPNVGSALSAHPGLKHMSFTGSPGVGRMVAESTGRNLVPCKLELGGKGAAVVFDDVDVAATAKALAGAITLNTGQVCCTATRWLVHENVFDQFVTEAKSALGSTIMGPSLDESTQMGPLASNVHRERVLGYLKRGREQGANMLLEPTTSSDKGYFVAPSLMSGTPDNVCCREEIFGPTAFIMKFNDEPTAINQVNSLTYGLANSVWSTDLPRASRVAEQMIAGNSWINAHNVFAYGLPYGGVNLSGLGGGVNSPDTLLNYLRSQTIARPL